MVVIPAHQVKQPGGIGSLESILGLLKSFKIWARNPKLVPDPTCSYSWETAFVCQCIRTNQGNIHNALESNKNFKNQFTITHMLQNFDNFFDSL
jgi:hypothetical protein